MPLCAYSLCTEFNLNTFKLVFSVCAQTILWVWRSFPGHERRTTQKFTRLVARKNVLWNVVDISLIGVVQKCSRPVKHICWILCGELCWEWILLACRYFFLCSFGLFLVCFKVVCRLHYNALRALSDAVQNDVAPKKIVWQSFSILKITLFA